jgi:succinate dehydrogenase/fumarate reductase flavoprotein subunit
MDSINTDVLVIGAGAAGIRAALAASEAGAETVMVSDGMPTGSGSTFSSFSGGWGIQALIGRERNSRNMEAFYDEIIHAGLGQCHPMLARILVEESGPCLEELLTYGIRFRKDPDGNYLRVKGCFSAYERAFLTEDTDNIRNSFLSILQKSSIKFINGNGIQLLLHNDSCRGSLILTGTHDLLLIDSRATVIATGGGAGLFNNSFVHRQGVGSGYAMAARAGAELINLEFIQFMLGLKSKDSLQFLPVSRLSAPGILKDEEGFDILDSYISDEQPRAVSCAERQSHFPFSCRDSSYLVDIAVADSIRNRRTVFWNGNGNSDNAEVTHFAHAFNGGLKINENAETTLRGLFAAGEIAAGPHGADRMGGCMMTATQVFGKKAGRSAALFAKKARPVPVVLLLPDQPEGLLSLSTRQTPSKLPGFLKEARESFSDNLMVLRNREKLESTLSLINEADAELDQMSDHKLSYYRMRQKDMLLVMKLITKAAINNPRSIGSHYRTDHPPV